MSERLCGCIYADERNTPSVRKGYEMGGYLKQPCEFHRREAHAAEMDAASPGYSERRAVLKAKQEV